MDFENNIKNNEAEESEQVKKVKKTAAEAPVKQTGSLKERLARIRRSRWIRFGVVSALFFGWVAWLGSWWVLVFWF